MNNIKIMTKGIVLACAFLLVSCVGNSSNETSKNVNIQVIGTNQVNVVSGGLRDVELLITSKKKISNFNFDNIASELSIHSGWSLVSGGHCATITPQKPCLLSLRYAPTRQNQSGVLHLNYTYNSPNINQQSSLQSIGTQNLNSTSTVSDSVTISYTSTSGNNVNANVTPDAQIIELVGLSQAVNISFATDNNESANNLTVTTSLSGLSGGWSSSESSLTCKKVDSSCILNLSYTPTVSGQSGTLTIAYTYYNNLGVQVSSTINIPYSSIKWGSSYSSTSIQYITANSVSAQNANMANIYPAVPSGLGVYLGSDSALGYLGPISQLGPLGPLGPLGSNTWDTTAWVYDDYTWADYYNYIYGPLSAAGPLGENGPYTTDAYYNGVLFTRNQFAANTRAFGLWSILGTIGPLGAVGALGALGPNGATGYAVNESGAYVDSSNQVVRSVSVPYNSSSSRTFDLYENYTQAYATQMPDNDTSFMVVGSLGLNSSNSYTITSSQDQIVSALVVPDSTIDTNIMYVGVYTTDGQLIALSNSDLYINYVMFTASANTSYVVKITASPDTISNAYRLYVTGSYDYLNEYYIQGDYIDEVSIN